MNAYSQIALDSAGKLKLHLDGLTRRRKSAWRSSPSQDARDDKVHDIRDKTLDTNLASSVRSGLDTLQGGKLSMPSLLLWDEAGLRHFEKVTYSPGYYLTQAEIFLLEMHAIDIAGSIAPGCIVLELGSGNLRKTGILLDAFEKLGKSIDYFALDLDFNELSRTLLQLRPERFQHVNCHCLLGTFDDGYAWISQHKFADRSKCILFLGSTIGSMTAEESSAFLRNWATILRARNNAARPDPGDKFILGIDRCISEARVQTAYQDGPGVNRAFILNALSNANKHLGYNAFAVDDWTAEGHWDGGNARHEWCLMPLKPVDFEGKVLQPGEKISLVYSHKYPSPIFQQLLDKSALNVDTSFMSDDRQYGIYMLSPA